MYPVFSSLAADFLTRLNAKFSEDSERMTMSSWIEANTTLRKRPYSFKGYEFQRAITDDMHPNMSVIKCSQIGLTEVQIRKFFAFLKRTTSINGIFTLPDDSMYKRVSQTRMKPILETDNVFNQHAPSEKPIRAMSLYQIDSSFGFITGNKESDATSINADFIFNDEVDLSDQEMLALFNSRLQGSNIRIRQGFSTPTFEGFGIDSSYKASDQHEYLCKCDRCNHWNLPVFTPKFVHLPGLPADMDDLSEIDPEIAARIDFTNSFVKCEHCDAPLDLSGANGNREWVPKHPGRLGRGYWVRPFSTSRLSPQYVVEQLLDYKRKNSLRRWYNTVLGEPFNDSNARLSLTEIEAVMRGESEPNVPPDCPVILGIDVGQTCHVVLAHLGLALPIVFSWRQVPSGVLVDEVKQILERYRLVAGCMDLNPYRPLSEEIRDISKGIISPVEYATTGSAAPITIVTDEFDAFSHVKSNRTLLIDDLVRDIRRRQITFTGYGMKKQIIQEHLQDMVRVEIDEKPASWSKLTGEDHFFHALGYMRHSIKVRELKNFGIEIDPRIMSGMIGLVPVQQSAEQLGVRGRRKHPSMLGLVTSY